MCGAVSAGPWALGGLQTVPRCGILYPQRATRGRAAATDYRRDDAARRQAGLVPDPWRGFIAPGRLALGTAARRRVLRDHDMPVAARRLDNVLRRAHVA